MDEWTRDKSGLWHWRAPVELTLQDAAARALDTCELATAMNEACWFWHDATFCPVVDGDTTNELVDRWRAWRNSFGCQCNTDSLEDRLRAWTE